MRSYYLIKEHFMAEFNKLNLLESVNKELYNLVYRKLFQRLMVTHFELNIIKRCNNVDCVNLFSICVN